MRALALALAASTLALAAGAAVAQTAAPGPARPASVSLAIKGADGSDKGTASFTAAPTGVLLRLEVTGMTPGWHGAHFHQKADCSDPKLNNSGSHIQHAGARKPHGLLNPQGPDNGDLPNLFVSADGTGQAEMFTTLVSWRAPMAGKPVLTDADGSALILHANPDDQITQPIGGAGDRLACVTITR